MSDRVTTAVLDPEDDEVERSLRPRRLDDFVGQERIKEQLGIALDAAKGRGEALDHVLLAGPPGLGYRGILLYPRGIPSLPRWVSVYDGTVELGEDPRHRGHKKDAKGLERWLKAEARKRGITIPE